MNTVAASLVVVNPTETPIDQDARAWRHGEDRAILGLSLENCTNAQQRAGWHAMTAQMDAWKRSAQTFYTPELDTWAAALHRRRTQADQRRAWALAIEAEADAILVDMDSPFFSGHEHEGVEVAL